MACRLGRSHYRLGLFVVGATTANPDAAANTSYQLTRASDGDDGQPRLSLRATVAAFPNRR